MSEYVDEEKTCRDCRGVFTFAAGEQQFYVQMAYNPPVRCKPCRDKRKAGSAGPPQAPRVERVAAVQPPRERPVRYEPEPEPDRRTKRQQHKGYRRREEEDDDYGGWR